MLNSCNAVPVWSSDSAEQLEWMVLYTSWEWGFPWKHEINGTKLAKSNLSVVVLENVATKYSLPRLKETYLELYSWSCAFNSLFPSQVYYVDHGFNEFVESNSVCRLQKQFRSLPFQAAKCKLAGKRKPVLTAHTLTVGTTYVLKPLWVWEFWFFFVIVLYVFDRFCSAQLV